MPLSQHDKAVQFRALHEQPRAFIIANAWDAGSAQLLAGLGFPAIATSSAASVTGRPSRCRYEPRTSCPHCRQVTRSLVEGVRLVHLTHAVDMRGSLTAGEAASAGNDCRSAGSISDSTAATACWTTRTSCCG